MNKVKTAVKSCHGYKKVREFLDELSEKGYDLRHDVLSITFDHRYDEYCIFYISVEI